MTSLHQEIGIIGAGGWGTALALLLAPSVGRIRLWAHRASHVEELRKTRRNESYLPGCELAANIEPTGEAEDLARAGLLLFVPPSRAMRELAERFAKVRYSNKPILVSATKGIEFSTGLRMSGILEEAFPGMDVAALSGPNHAEEIARGAPAATVIGARSMELAGELQELFNTDTFRVYRSDDIAGVELGGALKNIYALAAGVGDGLGLGDNAKAALITRALPEMIRIGTRLGGRIDTFHGLSGLGDLMVTCFSRHSRNRRVGEGLGKGRSLEEMSSGSPMVAEGVPTTRSVHELAARLKIDAPILEQVHGILEKDTPPKTAMHRLLGRDLKPEAGSQ